MCVYICIYIYIYTVCSEGRCALRHKQICRKCLRIKLNRFRPVETLVDITSNTFYKCTATFRTHYIYIYIYIYIYTHTHTYICIVHLLVWTTN